MQCKLTDLHLMFWDSFVLVFGTWLIELSHRLNEVNLRLQFQLIFSGLIIPPEMTIFIASSIFQPVTLTLLSLTKIIKPVVGIGGQGMYTLTIFSSLFCESRIVPVTNPITHESGAKNSTSTTRLKTCWSGTENAEEICFPIWYIVLIIGILRETFSIREKTFLPIK